MFKREEITHEAGPLCFIDQSKFYMSKPFIALYYLILRHVLIKYLVGRQECTCSCKSGIFVCIADLITHSFKYVAPHQEGQSSTD